MNMPMILIVDDEPIIRELLSKLFQRAGYHVTTAPNARKAISFLEEHRFTIALIDIGIPDLDGLELIRQYRGAQNFTQFIVITGDNSLSRRMEAFEVGAYGFLAKPFTNLKEIQEMVGRCAEHIHHWHSVLMPSSSDKTIQVSDSCH